MTLELDPADVRRAFGRAVSSYVVEPIDPHLRLHSVTGGVFRITADDETVVVKIVRHGVDEDPGALWVAGADLTHRNYWKREWCAFSSGVLESLPGRLRAPRLLFTSEPSTDECFIWMEDVRGRHGSALTLDDYGTVGYDLGTTQGAYASGSVALPTYDWLSRDWLRGWVDTSGRQVLDIDDDADWSDPRLRPLLPWRQRALDLWSHRDELVALVEAAPATVVHLDFWPMNVFIADDGPTVAVDWSQIGIGAVAQDLDQMTLDPVWMLVRDADPRELERIVIDGYVRGLNDAGSDVAAAQVWDWYAPAAAAKYLPLLELQVTVAADPAKVAAQERRLRRPFPEIVERKARVVARAVELGERALGSAS